MFYLILFSFFLCLQYTPGSLDLLSDEEYKGHSKNKKLSIQKKEKSWSKNDKVV